MAGEEQKDGAARLVLDLFKEQTLAVGENTKALRALMGTFLGVPPDPEDPEDEGQSGLIAQIAALQDAVEDLDERIIGLNVKMSQLEYVLDKCADIYEGDADAQPPVAGREPTLNDAILAWTEYRKKLEQEAEEELKRAEEEAAKAEAEEKAAAAGGQTQDTAAKPPMVSNTPPPTMFKKLPPLPTVTPRQ